MLHTNVQLFCFLMAYLYSVNYCQNSVLVDFQHNRTEQSIANTDSSIFDVCISVFVPISIKLDAVSCVHFLICHFLVVFMFFKSSYLIKNSFTASCVTELQWLLLDGND